MINDINCVLIISCYFFCWKVWIWSLRWNLGGKKCWCVSGKVNESFDLIYKTRKLLYVYIINLLIWTCKIRHCSSVKKCHMNKWMFVIQKHFFRLVRWLIDWFGFGQILKSQLCQISWFSFNHRKKIA